MSLLELPSQNYKDIEVLILVGGMHCPTECLPACTDTSPKDLWVKIYTLARQYSAQPTKHRERKTRTQHGKPKSNTFNFTLQDALRRSSRLIEQGSNARLPLGKQSLNVGLYG